MKKLLILTLTLTALTITALVGCAARDEKANNEPNSNNIEESSNMEQGNKSEILLAKVKKVVGNEVSVKLSDEKFQMEEGIQSEEQVQSFELDASQMAALENGETITLDDGGVMRQISIDPDALEDFNPSEGGIIAEPSEGMGVGGAVTDGGISFDGGLDGSTMFSEIDFDGEDKELIVSAGTEIFNIATGKAGKISDIKEGSILSIVIDSKTNTVTRIDIMG